MDVHGKKDLWNPVEKEWKSLSKLGMNYHASNKRCKEAITANIPWRPNKCISHPQPGEWIGNLNPNSDTPLNWVYFVLRSAQGKAEVIEYKRIAPNGRIQATTHQVILLSTANYRPVRVLSQERSGATYKVAKDPLAPGKKPLLFWIFEIGFVQNLPWDLGEWHWQASPPLGDAPFFGYTAKRGYKNTRKMMHTSNMLAFIQGLNLRNSTTSQVIARIWHNARPRKAGTLIWLTLNQGLLVGTWLQLMGIPPQCKVCNLGHIESPKHCLLECPMAQRAWEAYKKIWNEWKAPDDIVTSWLFVLLGEAATEREDDSPELLAYHTGGFTYPRQPLDILRSLLLYYLWSERRRRHFDGHYSLKQVLLQAWVATVKVGMATWKAIRSHCPTKDPDVQSSIELAFRKEWLHMNILGKDNATIGWHFLPPLYYLNTSND